MNASIKTICICGAGTMGSGIAQVTAAAGFSTVLYDVQQEILEKARVRIDSDLQKLVEKNKISSADKKNTLNRILFTREIQACIAEFVIEAVVEKMEVKVALLDQLMAINKPETIFASNTSSLSLTSVAQQLNRPKNLVGLHFFNPAPLMKLVEVVHTSFTDESILPTIIDLAKKLGKTPVVCRDSPGFIVNRVARPFYIESLRLAEEGKDFETIDRLLEAQGFKMGPFKLMDLIGNDINYAVSCSVYDQLNKPERLRPSDIQKEKVEQGALGKKTGEGYYGY